MRALNKIVLALACTAALTACGGGSDSSSDMVSVQNDSSATSLTVENDMQITEETTDVGTRTTIEPLDTDDTVTMTDNGDGSSTVNGLSASTETEMDKTMPLGNCETFQDKDAILAEINSIRATARMCGDTFHAATTPLSWNDALTKAALNHADYMVTTGELSHTQTTEGMEDVGKRITASGYTWSRAGENVAGGNVAYADVVQGWLNSPGHCANIMHPHYEDFGSACMTGSSNPNMPTMWAQAFGKSR